MQRDQLGWSDRARALMLAAFVSSALALPFAAQTSVATAAAPTTCGGKPATILGTERGDEIVGTAGNDVIVALGGGDVIDGAGGDDLICGGDANDVIKGGAGQDTLDGGAGNDSVDGGDGADRCVLADRDALTLCESTGSTMFALTGAADGTPAGPAPVAPTCNGKLATIVGTEMGDNITGTGGDDVIVALGGGDVIDAGSGNDTICSGSGRDQVTGGAGLDWIDGGADGDHLIGSTEVDTLIGSDGDDVLWGEGGNDKLDGGPGRDAIEGGLDNDLLVGGSGDDALTGGDGDDVLDGGPGASTDRDTTNGEDGNDACTTVTAPSTSQNCEGLTKLLGVTGGSITHGAATLTVPPGLLTVPSYAAIRHEIAGDRITKTQILGNLTFADLFADWKGRGTVTISMPFDATGTVGSPAVYRFGDDGTVAGLENIRVNSARTRVEFDTTALSGFAGFFGPSCSAATPRFLIPGWCRELQTLTPQKLKDKVVTRDSVGLTVACSVGAGAALLDPTPFGEAAVYAGCFGAMAQQLATPPALPDAQKRAIDCAATSAPIQSSGIKAGYACVGGIVQGLATDFLTNRSCKILDCGGMDAAVQEQRAAAARERAAREAAARAAATPSSPVPLPSQPPTSNYNPQGPTYNPQPPTYNPQPPTYNPQPPTYNPQSTYNPQR